MTDGILICGLGVRPEDDATPETLAALEGCRVIYCFLEDPSQFRWLRRHFPALRRASSASEIVAAARKKPGVALAVWGHPFYTSRLARQIQVLCSRAKVPVRYLSASSPLGRGFARAGEFLGGDEGWAGAQAYALEALIKLPALLLARMPAVVYAERGPRASWAKLGRLLIKHYPSGHPIRLQPAAGGDSAGTVEDLLDLELDGSVFLPPCEK